MDERIKEIEAMPEHLRDSALVRWRTVAALCDQKDVKSYGKKLLRLGLPVVDLNGRERLPRWGTLREFLRKLER